MNFIERNKQRLKDLQNSKNQKKDAQYLNGFTFGMNTINNIGNMGLKLVSSVGNLFKA